MNDNMLQLQQLQQQQQQQQRQQFQRVPTTQVDNVAPGQLCDLYPAVTSTRTTSFRRGHVRSPSDGDKPFIDGDSPRTGGDGTLHDGEPVLDNDRSSTRKPTMSLFKVRSLWFKNDINWKFLMF